MEKYIDIEKEAMEYAKLVRYPDDEDAFKAGYKMGANAWNDTNNK